MKPILAALIITLVAQGVALAQPIATYRYGADGYTAYRDVRIYASSSNKTFGNNLSLYSDGRVLLQYRNLELQPSQYTAALTLRVNGTISAATLSLYALTEHDWQDSGSDYYPNTDSPFPTWTHRNYNSASWQQPGVIGGSEVTLLQELYVTDANQVRFVFPQAITSGQNILSFLVASSAYVPLYNKETYTSALLPELEFHQLQAGSLRGGLDWNIFLRRWTPLR